MGHCLIVQLSREPIDKEDFIEPYTFDDDDDIRYVADYVCERDNYKESVEWFIEQLGDAVEYNEEDNSFTVIDRESFFKEDFKEFRAITEDFTLHDFCDSSWMNKIQHLARPWFGTYIYLDNYSQHINEFMRYYCDPGDKYYIGGICDYHC